MTPISLVLAEDQAMVRGALAALLGLEPDLKLLANVGDGNAALAAVRRLRPQILLTDIEMPERSGLDCAEAIREEALPTRVIIITTFGRAGYLRRAMAAGVAGYLLKDTPSDALAAAIRKVQAGGKVIDPELAAAGWGAPPDPLSPRERQALQGAAAGWSNQEIAERMGIGEGTVRNYLSLAFEKLGARNRIEAARMARDQGWL